LTVATASVALTQASPSATPVAPSNLRFVTP
jgi:hypothetical protein